MTIATQAVILDTDIGDDIDDALALVLLLHSPEVSLRGITTVFRDAPLRARFTQALLSAYDQEQIPLAAGVSQPLLQTWEALGGQHVGKQFEALPAAETEAVFPHALDWLIEAIQNHDKAQGSTVQGPLVLLCIGPLTNAALLLTRAPELASRLHIVLMGGMFAGESHDQPWEWNIYCDPEAAAIVLRSGATLSIVPIDVTRRCVLTPEQCRRLENSRTPGGRLLAHMVQLWRAENGNRTPILHDPLAALTLFEDVVTWQDKRVEVGLCGTERGTTRFVEGPPNCRVALEVNAPRALETFLQRVMAGETEGEPQTRT